MHLPSGRSVVPFHDCFFLKDQCRWYLHYLLINGDTQSGEDWSDPELQGMSRDTKQFQGTI